MRSIDAKVWELIKLDSSCGMKQKKEILMINDRIVHDLNYCQHVGLLDISDFRSELKKLKYKTKCRTKHAINLILSCRKCNSPHSLLNCV